MYDERVPVSTGTGEVRDLDWDVGCGRNDLLQKDAGFVRTIGDLRRDGGPHVYNDRHPVSISSGEQPTDAIDVRGVVVINPGVREMQLQSAPQPRILRTASELVKCVLFQRIDAAEANETIRKPCDLAAGPIVLCFDLRIFVRGGSFGITEDVGPA